MPTRTQPQLQPQPPTPREQVGVERALVERNGLAFRRAFLRFLRFMIPVACLNSLLKYSTFELSLGLRQRLTAYLQVQGHWG